jgi:hypothetical protein
MPEHSKGKKNRKYTRNKIKCERYAREHRRVKNGPKVTDKSKGLFMRTPHDPERMKHGERRKKESKGSTVRKVP